MFYFFYIFKHTSNCKIFMFNVIIHMYMINKASYVRACAFVCVINKLVIN